MNKIQIVKNKNSLWVNWVGKYDPDMTYCPTEVVMLSYSYGKVDVQDAKVFRQGGKYATLTCSKDDLHLTRDALAKAYMKSVRVLLKKNRDNLRRARERAAARKVELELHLKSVEGVERFAKRFGDWGEKI